MFTWRNKKNYPRIITWYSSLTSPLGHTDQMLYSAASDLGLHSLQRPICRNTYGYWSKSYFWFGVLQPSQSHVELDSKPTHTIPSRSSPLSSCPVLVQITSASNWQLPFLNQRNEENDLWSDFMINPHETNVPELGFELATPGSKVRWATDCAVNL